jgi:hypothetical protein
MIANTIGGHTTEAAVAHPPPSSDFAGDIK